MFDLPSLDLPFLDLRQLDTNRMLAGIAAFLFVAAIVLMFRIGRGPQ